MSDTYKYTVNQLAWLEALESGDYKQVIGTLKKNDGYCCLGVACEISGLGKFDTCPDKMDDTSLLYICPGEDFSGAQLPYAVKVWLGFKTRDGNYNVVRTTLYSDNEQNLPHHNDVDKWDFKQIAAFIRANPAKFFVS
jgi:hypothetical protein